MGNATASKSTSSAAHEQQESFQSPRTKGSSTNFLCGCFSREEHGPLTPRPRPQPLATTAAPALGTRSVERDSILYASLRPSRSGSKESKDQEVLQLRANVEAVNSQVLQLRETIHKMQASMSDLHSRFGSEFDCDGRNPEAASADFAETVPKVSASSDSPYRGGFHEVEAQPGVAFPAPRAPEAAEAPAAPAPEGRETVRFPADSAARLSQSVSVSSQRRRARTAGDEGDDAQAEQEALSASLSTWLESSDRGCGRSDGRPARGRGSTFRSNVSEAPDPVDRFGWQELPLDEESNPSRVKKKKKDDMDLLYSSLGNFTDLRKKVSVQSEYWNGEDDTSSCGGSPKSRVLSTSQSG